MDIAADVKGFAEWFGGDEGFGIRAERFDGDVSWLKAAYAAGVAAERERAAKVCEHQAHAFLSPEYAADQPLGSFSERFACTTCASAIRSGETGK